METPVAATALKPPNVEVSEAILVGLEEDSPIEPLAEERSSLRPRIRLPVVEGIKLPSTLIVISELVFVVI